jgi:hypothetical protein
MLSCRVQQVVFATFAFLSETKILPFDFNRKTQLFSVPTSPYRFVYQVIQNLLLILTSFYAFYVLYELIRKGAGFMVVGRQLIHIASTISSTVYLMDLTIYRHEFVSIFNRIISLNSK